MRLPERARAALLFALAGAGASALHVLVETAGALRDWRQTLPLAAMLGGALGWIAAPATAGRGALTALAGIGAFVAVFALGHATISGEDALTALWRAAGAAAGPGGAAALALGALAGWASGRLGPRLR